MVDKKSFVLYNSYIDQIEILTDEDAGKLIKKIFRYANGLELEKLSQEIDMCFAFIKAQMDRDIKEYVRVCEERSKAGKRSATARATAKAMQELSEKLDRLTGIVSDDDNEDSE